VCIPDRHNPQLSSLFPQIAGEHPLNLLQTPSLVNFD